jgi:pimeloyl-ACP methyl ester carboxylesterase
MHKMVWSSAEFASAQPVLARRGVRSVAIDLPGYGQSDAPQTEPTADQFADAILPVLTALDIRRPVLLGTNTGATLVAAFALRHPERTRAIILDGPPVFPPEDLPGLLAEPEFDRTARRDGAEFVARWRELDAMGKGGLEAETIRTGLMQFFAAGPHYLWGHQAIFKYPLAATLGKLTPPVALLTYRGDQLRAQSLALKREHPGFTLIDTPFPRMMADFQDPEVWANAVADYVLAAR